MRQLKSTLVAAGCPGSPLSCRQFYYLELLCCYPPIIVLTSFEGAPRSPSRSGKGCLCSMTIVARNCYCDHFHNPLHMRVCPGCCHGASKMENEEVILG